MKQKSNRKRKVDETKNKQKKQRSEWKLMTESKSRKKSS